MNRRLIGVVFALSALLFACFARLAADPSALIVNSEQPSIDHARQFDDNSVGNDLTRLLLPHHLGIARAIASFGHVPLWDDRGFGGRPLVGNPQGGLFYPPTWLAWWSAGPSTLGWITLGHLLFSGLGAYRLARTLGMGGWGCLVAAGCVQASPYVLGQTFEGHYPHVWAACWYPWAFDASIRLHRGERRSAPQLAVILAATLLTGHPQEAYYLLIALGSWAAFGGLVAIRSGRGREACRLWISGLGALAMAVGLIGVELITDVLVQEWGLRGAKLSLKLASRYHLYPINGLQLLSPRALGGPADYFGHDNYWESVTSIGLIPLSLAIVAVAWSPHRRAVRGWLILVAASVLFASGRKLGFFAAFFEILPGMERFRVPARSLFLASLSASMLAGLGVEALRGSWAECDRWRRLARRFGTSAAIVALLVLSGGWPGEQRTTSATVLDRETFTLRDRVDGLHPRSHVSEIDRVKLGLSRLSADPAFWLAMVAVPLGLAIGVSQPRHRRAIASTLGLLGLIELGFHGHDLIKTSPSETFFGRDPISEALLRARPAGLGPPRIRAVDALYDDLRAGAIGLSKTNVNDSFQLQHAADLYEPLYHLFDADLFDRGAPMDRAVADYRREIRQQVLDRMAVSLLVADRVDPEVRWPLFDSGVWNGSTFAVYRNPTALPRAYVVPRAEVAPDNDLIVDRFRELDPRQAVLMTSEPLASAGCKRQPFTPAEWKSADPDRVALQVTTEAPGLLVVADTWMPGWTAEVDGRPAPVLRGNRAQRVVPLPEAGRHEVVLSYWPPGLNLGVAITVASSLLCAAWLAIGPRDSSFSEGSMGDG
jgi:Bacterial membrane protein YfhO